MIRKIYLDHSATTPVDRNVVKAMLPYFTENYGNPSSIHQSGRAARTAVEAARSQIAKLIHAKNSEIYFVSGGTEANNLAIRGVALANRNRGNHIITTRVEHPAVLETCKALEKEGFQITYLNVDEHGMVDPETVKQAIRKETILVSIIFANHEVGTINPVEEIGRITREANIFFHSDAVQGFGKIKIDINKLGIDLLSISGHKIYGPKGIGALYIRRGTPISRIIHGGAQEQKRRAGTENVPGIVGLATAAELIYTNLEEESQRISQLRDYFQQQICDRFKPVKINGHPKNRLYHNLNVSFEGCESQSLLLSLSMVGIAASMGSACTSGIVEESPVLKAMGLTPVHLRSAIRFTLGKQNTKDEIDYVLEKLEEIIPRLRKVSKFNR